MSRVRVFLKPFDVFGNYVSDFIEITDDVKKAPKISQSLGDSKYNLGVFRTSSLNLVLNNRDGRFSPPGSRNSIFAFKIADTEVKITWDKRPYDWHPPFDEYWNRLPVGEEIEVFRGVVSDAAISTDIFLQQVSLQVFGLESLLSRVEFPSGVVNTDLMSDAIFDVLNQAPITDLLTVDAGNISVGQDEQIDDVTKLANQDGARSIQSLLQASNSVLRVDGTTIYVSPRTASATVDYEFFGQSSESGIENFLGITDYSEGWAKIYNFWTWQDNATAVKDATSISTYGVRAAAELRFAFITNTTSQGDILTSYKDEFAEPKKEMKLIAPMNYDTLDLGLLSKVTVDHPPIYYPADGEPIPRWGFVKWGSFRWPFAQTDLVIDSTDEWKILEMARDFESQTIEFYLREV